MNQPEPQSIPFPTLLSDIEKGLIKIPQFQRDFVWTKEKSAHLIDSMLKGFPIGTFILWKTKESLRTVRNLGDMELPPTPAGDFTQHVLDGQQRITSLFAAAKGLTIKRDDRDDDFSEIYVDLEAHEDEAVVTIDPGERTPDSLITIVKLLSAGVQVLSKYPEKHHARLDEYKQRLTSYSFSIVLVKEAPIDIATEIFTRINVTGKPLSVFEIMVAKTFDSDRDFDLSEEYDKLVDNLRNVSYDTLPPSTVLQTVSAILVGECAKKHILKLSKEEFIGAWPGAIQAIYTAVDYFRNVYRIPVSQLLPYGALIVVFAYFFSKHPNKPKDIMRKRLQDLFWRVSLGGYYSHSLESRLAQDVKRVDAILNGQLPTYDYAIDVSPSFVESNGWFSANRSFVKAILCIYAYRQPRSFNDDSLVRISNDWLKRANSKNYHHFFPKAFLEKQNYEHWYANQIANITIVDDYLNKALIRAKAPATYMKSFAKENDRLRATMRTHLISLKTDGVWENDYEKFIANRCKAIAKELKKRVIPQAIDAAGQQVRTDDYDEAEISEVTA